MNRRTFLKTSLAGIGSATALSGCISQIPGSGGSDDLSGTLRVATYQSFVESPSSSPGAWVKENFEEEYPDATIEWKTPESGLNYFVQRKEEGVEMDADVYVGLNVDDLIRVDERLGDDGLFTPAGDGLENVGGVKEPLQFDPQRRAIPYDTGYISLVYDENEVEEPRTFDALLEPEYQGKLLAQNAQQSDPGQAFLLWTIDANGPDGYLDYWERLVENDVRIFGDWYPSYNAYLSGEAPMIVSYSTDQVFAARDDLDMSRHQIGFLEDQGYANPEGMARFADTGKTQLANAFMDFVLTDEAQAKIATLNVQFPATESADPGGEFGQYAKEPPEIVSYGYDELRGKLDGWVEAWAQQIATK